MIDKSKIKAGDQVKIRWEGLVSEDWQNVVKSTPYELKVGALFLTASGVEVIEHKPSFKELEDAVEAARIAWKKAEENFLSASKELNDAKNPSLKYAYGTRIYYSGFDGRPKYGTVIPCPDSQRKYDDENKIWAIWHYPQGDQTGFVRPDQAFKADN